ncbi:MAG: biosynthetic-type acetolactate synthase large subunit [Oscillospiraceae bacterium]|jgi:acetolactate synthase-1/2/3 large subunit|nr:biosynthetic-type acetolactate synthase large subunit [Oscillospiraceae bacterium]
MKISGAEIVVKTLISHNVSDVFGYPGGCVLNIYDELYKYSDKVNHILTAHEQGASHAADGYARATGKTGVVIATSGPGATNLVTGIATAYLDSVPLVAITGNVNSNLIGKDSFQEVDITGITMPITKYNFIVKSVDELEETLCKAFQIAASGRQGPVLVDIPKDIQIATSEFKGGFPLKLFPHNEMKTEDLKEIAELIQNAEKPYIYAGGGVISSESSAELLKLSQLADAPVGFSMMGLTAMDYRNPKKLGMTGMHGLYTASKMQSEADLIIGIGVRFSDRATGNTDKYKENVKIIHIDTDRAEINKNITVDKSIIGDIKDILTELNSMLKQKNLPEWNKQTEKYREITKELFNETGFCPKKIIKTIHKYTKDDTVVTTDVGQHQMWTAMHYNFANPRTFVTSGGLGTMGFGLGAAIGASVAKDKSRTVHVTGDGSFHMNLAELATVVTYNIPVVTVILNNGVLGLVRQWQRQFYGERFSNTTLNRKTDYVKLAEAFGAKGFRAETEEELISALDEIFNSDYPAVIDCRVDCDAKVLPMIPPGGSISDIMIK